jgi:hypothetical protein
MRESRVSFRVPEIGLAENDVDVVLALTALGGLDGALFDSPFGGADAPSIVEADPLLFIHQFLA